MNNNSTQMNPILIWIERTGNRLPDPVFIFLYLTLALIAMSVVFQYIGLSAFHPTQRDAAGQFWPAGHCVNEIFYG